MIKLPSLILVLFTALLTQGQSGSSPAVTPPAAPAAAPSTRTVPTLSPAESMKTFTVAPGYRVELVASEPMVIDPVVIEFDPDGRLWVVEMPGYMKTIAAAGELDPIGRIVVLEDTNDDGRMDKRTVFADGLVLARSLKILSNGVLVGEPPNLYLMRDTNGDLKADTREVVTDMYGRREANVEHNANALTWALDNWIYTSEVDMDLRLKHGRFEVRKVPARGQWGNSQDDGGRIYRNTNESVLHVDLVPSAYYGRNPNLLRTRGSYESLAGDANEVNAVWPAHPTRGVNRGYQAGVLRPDGRLATFSSVAAPLVYRGDRLPRDVYGNVFVVEPAGNLVSRIILSDDAAGIRAKKAYEGTEFLAATDERFRPVNLANAPDGTLYIVDMYRGVIQHRGYITEYLRDHIVSNSLEQPIGYGRIYRVVHETTTRDRKPAMSGASAAALVGMLSHPNGWRRDTAQRMLVERDDASVVAALATLAASAPDPRTRLHALWTLDGIDRLEKTTVLNALKDEAKDMRLSAVRVAERWMATDAAVRDAVLALGAGPDAAVRRQVAATLGVLSGDTRDAAVASLLERHGDDPILLDAALSGVANSEVALLQRLKAGAAETPQLRAATTLLAATVVRGKQEAAGQQVFEMIADGARPEWQRAAILGGVEAAVLGSALPGSVTRGRGAAPANAPCPTCPGGRMGPGGASAFPTTGARAGAPPAATGGRGNAAVAMQLSREPALVQVAGAGGELGQRATAVLARLGWPGKAGMASVAALTTPEQARFEAGQVIYRAMCEACHQPDGRGREKLAPSLVGSELALGPEGISIRVLMNGKEGPVGLMPPLGAAMTDDQIAAVLTYVRRAWGEGAPVTPASVAALRPETQSRTRPWTNEELQRIAASAGR